MWQGNPEAIPFGVAAALSGSLAAFAWQRKSLPMAPSFIAMMVGETAWALFEAIELSVGDATAQAICYQLRTLGAVVTVLGVLAFVLKYTGSHAWLEWRYFALVCAPALVLVLVAWTNPLHHLYWKGHITRTDGALSFAIPVYGPGFWSHFAYCYVLVAVAALLLAQAVLQSVGVYRAQAAVMLFAVLLPWVVNMVDMSELFGYIHIDTAAMTFAVTGLAFVPGLFRFRLLDLAPIAWAVVVRGMTDPVVVFDLSGRIVDLNDAALRLVGRPYSAVLGASAERTFAHWPAILEHLEQFRADADVAFEIGGPAGSSTFDARISRLGRDVHPAGWVLVLRDVTFQRDAAEERLRLLREQAARAEAEAINIAKDRFLATLSHELRTPLTPILATATAMLADPETPASLRSLLEMIRRNIMLEARLIDDLLDLARIRRGSLLFQREIIDAHRLVADVIDICGDELKSGNLEVVVELKSTDFHIDGDPLRFQQALWNLIKNAIKFTPAGGRITVRSLNSHVSDGVETAGNGRPTAPLVIEVEDTGIGIQPEVLPHIFDVLEQGGVSTTRRYGGLGLGLTISRSIIEQHGGRLAAVSPGPGRGATFTIEMPTTSPPTPRSADVSPATGEVSHTSRTDRAIDLLLVDDNEDTLYSLTRLLSVRGYRVHPAADMTTAIEIASALEFDVLISDIELPDGSGHELMWKLRTTRAISGIAVSGFGAPTDIEQSRAAGFAIHLTKPIDFRQLEDAIERVTTMHT